MLVTAGSGRYDFRADGAGLLRIAHLNFWRNVPKFTEAGAVAFELGEGVTEVEPGFFDLFPGLTEIKLADTVTQIALTEQTQRLLRANDVLICGSFDRYAEQFAKEQGLRFVHADLELAADGDYFDGGIDLVTLRFDRDGSAFLHQNSLCQGSSSGSSGGGEERIALPADFALTHTPEELAALCWGNCREKIRRCEALAVYLQKAKERHSTPPGGAG
ncbi:MAG: hypothetical protein IJC43_09510 [Clostridia bacterium]|nr:hypothetical protein [Clostridia bacterium]